MSTALTTKTTFRVSLTVDGVDWGVWQAKTGGKVNGNTSTTRPGGMGPAVALPGTQTVDNVTLTRPYDRVRDHDQADQLVQAAGKGRAVVKQRPLDPDGNGYGKSIVWSGILESVELPDTDANATDQATITIEITPDGPVSFQ